MSDTGSESFARELAERRYLRKEKRTLRDHQFREDAMIFKVDQRCGRYRQIITAPAPRPLPWDGVRNSQITPIDHIPERFDR